MNSDKAAAVRDAINGCPTVIDGDEDVIERDGDPFSTTSSVDGGKTLTGDRLDTTGSYFRPAYIEQSGTLANGSAERPVFVVVLESLWTETDDARSLSPELVYEVAKHDCRIRFYPPDHRLDGDIWICDHFQQTPTDTNGDRCPDCESTYFKIRDGEPECARCGYSMAPEDETATTLGEFA